jgi:glutathione S-transferase
MESHRMTPVITAFAASPDRGRGLARDMAVRWAFEEVGQPYDVELVSFAEMKLAPHLARQPFGQIPSYVDDDLVLFESGAIVLHIAGLRPGLLPADPAARARAIAWMFAAFATVEQPITELELAALVERDAGWFAARQPLLDERVRRRLGQLADRLGAADWLDGGFSAGDLVMINVLRRLDGSPLLAEFPVLAAYVARGEARPAFQRAFAAQRAVFLRQAGLAGG